MVNSQSDGNSPKQNEGEPTISPMTNKGISTGNQGRDQEMVQ